MKIDGEYCRTCGYAECDGIRKKKEPKLYCTNLRSEHFAEWVKARDVCPLWIAYGEVTKYYTL